MSTRKGRAQRYQNSVAYKVGRYGHTKQTKLASTVSLGGICKRCRDKIEWRIKYGKYKPLTTPKSCVVCEQKKIKQAYYRLCQECARSGKVCAKCGEKEKIAESFPLSTKDKVAEEAQFRHGLKLMTERERRKFLREQLSSESKKTTAEPVCSSRVSDDEGSDCDVTEMCAKLTLTPSPAANGVKRTELVVESPSPTANRVKFTELVVESPSPTASAVNGVKCAVESLNEGKCTELVQSPSPEISSDK